MNHLSLKSYIVGFVLSLLLTLVPYVLVEQGMASRSVLVVAVVVAAVIQLVVQLGFFLHLSFKPSERDGLLSFAATGIIIFVIVFGSLWVMHDLNYFMMDPVMEEHALINGTGGHGHHGSPAPVLPPDTAGGHVVHGQHLPGADSTALECHPKTDSVAKEGMSGHGSSAAGEHHH